MNPRWIQIIVATAALALFLRIGLGIPFLTTVVAVGIIFTMHAVMTDLSTGATTAADWAKKALNVLLGVVIFLVLRFVAAKLLGSGHYPIDTYETLNSFGGLYGIFPAKDISTVLLWEVAFAGVAGSITVYWINGTWLLPVRAVFVGTLVILTTGILFPSYVNSWPSRDDVSDSLENRGVIGSLVKGTWVLAFGKPAPTATQAPAKTAPVTPPPSATTPDTGTASTPELGRDIVQLPDCKTPCILKVQHQIHDIYTDGSPVMVLPPGWEVKDAIPYAGHGHMVLRGVNIGSGDWKFWSSEDPKKAVMIRVFAVK